MSTNPSILAGHAVPAFLPPNVRNMKLFPVLRVYNKDPMRARLLLRCSLVLLASLACLASLRAQEAGKIIEQYVKAAGGSGKLSKLQTVSLEGSLTRFSDGKTGTFTLDIKTPSRYYMELIAGDQPEIL